MPIRKPSDANNAERGHSEPEVVNIARPAFDPAQCNRGWFVDTGGYRASRSKKTNGVWRIQRALRMATLYGLATGGAIEIERYRPHSFKTSGRPPRIEGYQKGIWTTSIRHLWELLRRLQFDSKRHDCEQTMPINGMGKNNTFKSVLARASSFLESLQILQILSDPTPRVFLVACIIYSLAIALLWKSQTGDKYRIRIMGVGITTGVLVTLQEADILLDGKAILAWSIVFALAISSIIHSVLGLWEKPDVCRKDEEARGEKIVLQQETCASILVKEGTSD